MTEIIHQKTTEQDRHPTPLNRTELKQVEERVAIAAHIVRETIKREGEDEFKRSSSALGCPGLAAGLSMVFRWWQKPFYRNIYPLPVGRR